MDTMLQQFQKAERFNNITQRIGFALWQIQELEGISAEYFVLITQAKKGMGENAGNALVEKAKKKTFGSTIHNISKKGLLSADIKDRFFSLLKERNWLVHSSRADSRNAIHSDKVMEKLILRIENMASEALSLLKEIGALISSFVESHGVSKEYVNKKAKELLKQWHESEEI